MFVGFGAVDVEGHGYFRLGRRWISLWKCPRCMMHSRDDQ